MASVPTAKLSSGQSIPCIGFGTGTALFKSDCTDLVLQALHNGYRYLDTAQQYGNADSVGNAIKQWKGNRDELFIVTKFGVDGPTPTENDARNTLEEQLKLLGLPYVDLYLIHNPFYAGPDMKKTWALMEQLLAEGLTKAIGVSNFREEDILKLKETWKTPPAVNQIEFNPYVYHAPNMQRLLKLCKAENITIESYGPLNSLFRSTDGPIDAIVERIAKEKGSTPSQVLIAWAYQFSGGGPIVTTSRNDGRQREQLEALSKAHLTDDEVTEIAEAGKKRFYRHFQGKVWNVAKE